MISVSNLIHQSGPDDLFFILSDYNILSEHLKSVSLLYGYYSLILRMAKRKYKQARYTGQPSKRKFKGFGYYIQANDKLSKKEREDVLNRSEIYLSEVYSTLPHDTETKIKLGITSELDNSLSDLELKDIWNEMYDTYGYLMSDFKDKWVKDKLKGDDQNLFKQSIEFEELETRVSALESEVMKLKRQLKKPAKGISEMG